MTPARDSLGSRLRRAIVHVLKGAGAAAGTGFFVSENLIATCAHIAEEVGNSEITVELFDGRPVKTKIRAGTRRPPNEGDVVLLDVQGEPPPDIPVLKFGSSVACEGHTFQTYGFPVVRGIDGLPDEGTILGKTRKG